MTRHADRPIITCPTCGSNYRESWSDPGCSRCAMNEHSRQEQERRRIAWENDPSMHRQPEGDGSIDALWASIGMTNPVAKKRKRAGR